MSYFNAWCPHGIKVFRYVYLYHSSLHHIHIFETAVVIFGISTVRKSWATETSSMSRCQNIILWKLLGLKDCREVMIGCGCTKFPLVFKYHLIDFVFYHTSVWWAKFTETSSKTLTVQILSIWQFKTLFIS